LPNVGAGKNSRIPDGHTRPLGKVPQHLEVHEDPHALAKAKLSLSAPLSPQLVTTTHQVTSPAKEQKNHDTNQKQNDGNQDKKE
jgi:hypothetical protein